MPHLHIPLDVPRQKRNEYLKNWKKATKNTGHLLLFAGDQKVEHLNDDFYGAKIATEDASPEHLFQIAAQGEVGVLAVQLGLVARYGEFFRQVPYLIKLNGRTNLFDNKEKLLSRAWLKVEDVVKFKEQSRLNVLGVGYTIYLGGEYESKMLKEAAKIVNQAHATGLLAVIWVYPRSQKIKDEDNLHLIAGGAGVAACLGADFIKVKYPYGAKNAETSAKNFQEVSLAAGRSGVICVGGSKQKTPDLLRHAYLQIKHGGGVGMALGRNLHQRPLEEAVRLTKAISAIIYHGKDDKEAYKIFNQKSRIKGKTARLLRFFSF